MFVKTVKLKKPSPLVIGIILAGILIIIAVWVIGFGGKGVGDKYKLPSNTERVKFLTNLGWNVSNQETDSKVVKIPTTFNTVYDVYNKIQKEQGFDLTKQKGKTVEIYTYDVYNYPNKSKNIVAHLIVCDGVLIGGDVCCTETDGFMHGLMPSKGELNNSGQKNTEQNAATTQAPATTTAPTGTSKGGATTTQAPATTTAKGGATTQAPATTKSKGANATTSTSTTKQATTQQSTTQNNANNNNNTDNNANNNGVNNIFN